MKVNFSIDTTIYSLSVITQSINDYKEVAKIEYSDNILSIYSESKDDAQEIFSEFMNYVVSLWWDFFSSEVFTTETMQDVNLSDIGYFRFKKFDSDSYLITNDIGKYHFLSYEHFHMFIHGQAKFLPEYDLLIQNGFILTPDYVQSSTEYYREKTSFIKQGPSLHMMVITLRCNHHCRYCHAAVAPEDAIQFDMSIETAQKTIDFILCTTSKNITIEFQWGEPLLNWEVLVHSVEYARNEAFKNNKNLGFTLVTNLTIMTEDKLAWLLDNKIDICTSLDGSELTHNKNRTGYKGNSFKKVVYWIKKINEEKAKQNSPKIGALLTTTKSTIPHYKEVINEYIDLGLDGIALRWLNPYGFASGHMNELGYSKDQRIDFYAKSLDYILEKNKEWLKFNEYMTTIYLKKIFSLVDPGFMDIRNPTWLILGGLAYNYDGKIYASDESRMLGRLGDDTFYLGDNSGNPEELYTTIINSEKTLSILQSSILEGLPGYDDHVYKPYIGVDIISNHKLTESVYQPLKKDEKMQIQIAMLDIIFMKLKNQDDREILISWIQN